ncbi:F0F1 ATP synthase subunit A [Candidatus Woesebacteria bacterium]|nr:F0F1 ATP synthase subunit A [Candidatus Woesebacteria bacterium]
MAATGIHISISAEPLFSIGGFEVSNSIFTSLIVSALLIGFGIAVRSQLTNTRRPAGLQNFAEWLIESLYGLVYSVAGNAKKARLFFPFIATFFLFILLNNWLGLVPGVGTIGIIHNKAETTEEHASSSVVDQVQAATEPVIASEEAVLVLPQDHLDAIEAEQAITQENNELPAVIDTDHSSEPVFLEDDHADTSEAELAPEESHSTFVPLLRPGSADLNTTLALALFSVGLTQLFGYHFQKLSYFKKFVNFSSPIMFFVGILEIVSEFAKIISFAFRLFGNIFAGEVLLAVMMFLIPLVIPMPFYGLEIFVGFIQAVVFAMLSLVFFNMASESHDSH